MRSLAFVAILLVAIIAAVSVQALSPARDVLRSRVAAGDDQTVCSMPDVYRLEATRDSYVHGNKTEAVRKNRWMVDLQRGFVRVDTTLAGDSRGNLTTLAYERADPQEPDEFVYFEYQYDTTGYCDCVVYPGSKERLQNPLEVTKEYDNKGTIIWRGLRANIFQAYINTGHGRNIYRMHYVLPNSEDPLLCQFLTTFETTEAKKTDTYDQDIYSNYEPDESDPKDFVLPSKCPEEKQCRLA